MNRKTLCKASIMGEGAHSVRCRWRPALPFSLPSLAIRTLFPIPLTIIPLIFLRSLISFAANE